MIVNLVDRRAGGTGSNGQDHRPQSQTTDIVVQMADNLEKVVGRVVRTVRNRRSIWLLRIVAHGNTGSVQLGGEGLDINTAGKLKALREFFTPGGIGIALHSCGSASNTDILGDPVVNEETNTTIYPLVPGTLAAGGGRGVDFLRRLAASCDVPVRGGIHSQLNDRRYRFEGRSIVALPNGRAFPIVDWGRLAYDTTRIAARD